MRTRWDGTEAASPTTYNISIAKRIHGGASLLSQVAQQQQQKPTETEAWRETENHSARDKRQGTYRKG